MSPTTYPVLRQNPLLRKLPEHGRVVRGCNIHPDLVSWSMMLQRTARFIARLITYTWGLVTEQAQAMFQS